MKILKILWIKRYFDTGLGLTNYLKWLIAIFGYYSLAKDLDPIFVISLGILYLLSCILIGWLWIKHKLIEQENEISNILNPFQVEIRKKLKGKKFK